MPASPMPAVYEKAQMSEWISFAVFRSSLFKILGKRLIST